MQGFETVKSELDSKRLQLERELEAARGRVDEIQADLERVHEALGALTGHKKKASSSRSSRRRPVPSVQDLQHFIEHVRQRSPFANANELLESVRSLVRDSRKSLTGYKTLFAQALASSPGSEHGSSHEPDHRLGSAHSHSGEGHHGG